MFLARVTNKFVAKEGATVPQDNVVYQRSCQNRNNLLLLIKWLSHKDPTLAATLLLQRNDIIAKKVDDNLLVAPCNSGNITQNTVEFKSGIISKFEIERINAEIETLAAKQKTINSVPHQQNMETIWQEISQEGEELAEQLDDEIGKATLLIQNELSEFALHWRMITGGTSMLILLIVLIIVKLKCQLILSLYAQIVIEIQIKKSLLSL
ncbi:Integrase core domain containing protein [Dirofilaria immitis]|nr:Integrase core domain containing protein [Dirofilaria immitis]